MHMHGKRRERGFVSCQAGVACRAGVELTFFFSNEEENKARKLKVSRTYVTVGLCWLWLPCLTQCQLTAS
jgi:hypothetical protein